MGDKKTVAEKNMIAWYPFDDEKNIGKDSSGNNNTAVAYGTRVPQIEEVNGRKAVHIFGGEYSASYLELPKDIFLQLIQ